MKSSDQIKGNIKSLAKKKGLKPQEVFQMYFFERVLKRLEKSPYRETFIIKGGLLISSLIGIDNRTTMDMDTTVKGIALTEGNITRIVKEILAIDDNIDIKLLSQAIVNTSRKRESLEDLLEYKEILEDIQNDDYLKENWHNYLKDNSYVGKVKFEDTLNVLREIFHQINIS